MFTIFPAQVHLTSGQQHVVRLRFGVLISHVLPTLVHLKRTNVRSVCRYRKSKFGNRTIRRRVEVSQSQISFVYKKKKQIPFEIRILLHNTLKNCVQHVSCGRPSKRTSLPARRSEERRI